MQWCLQYIILCYIGPCYNGTPLHFCISAFLCIKPPIKKIKLSWGLLIFIVGISMLVRCHLVMKWSANTGTRGINRCIKNAYKFVYLGTNKFSTLHKNHIFQSMGKIFCVEFRYPLKFHTKYLTHTLKDVLFVEKWRFKSSQVYELVNVFEMPPGPTMRRRTSQGWPHTTLSAAIRKIEG